EELLCRVWCDLLGLDRVGVADDFFELGGDSLLANQVVARVRDEVGVQVPLRDVFDRPTITGLADVITTLGMASEADDDLLGVLADLEEMPADGALAAQPAEAQQ